LFLQEGDKFHYCLISSLNAFYKDINDKSNSVYVCERCLQSYYKKDSNLKHRNQNRCYNYEKRPTAIKRHPQTDVNNTVVSFETSNSDTRRKQITTR